ncbi:MAG: heme-degrading monooxygenase HmoA [Parvicella sp.]|jgi:heme-degrading monooxygenase HmoA
MIKPPYYAVNFTSKKHPNINGYPELSDQMENLAKTQTRYLGMNSAQSEFGITNSDWKTLEDIQNWKSNPDHLIAEQLGRSDFHKWYPVKIVKVEREYNFEEL